MIGIQLYTLKYINPSTVLNPLASDFNIAARSIYNTLILDTFF